MSESHPVYVHCASGNNSFTDCLVLRHGDLLRLIGHAQMDFTQGDAKTLAYAILDRLSDPFVKLLEAKEIESGDAIVDEARAMLLKRAKLGQEKYGTTLMRNDLALIDWMRHAIEESLDRTLYMIRALKDLEKLYDDGR